MRSLRNDQRGSAIVEMPLAICIILLLGMGVLTIVQVTWTHLSLSSAVRTSTRYATHVDYDPVAGGIGRHRDAGQVQAWTEQVAAEAGVEPGCGCITIVGRHLPSMEVAPIEELVAGDEITITVESVVSNPLYRVGASVANAAARVIGAGDVFDPDGVGVRAEAVSYVE